MLMLSSLLLWLCIICGTKIEAASYGGLKRCCFLKRDIDTVTFSLTFAEILRKAFL